MIEHVVFVQIVEPFKENVWFGLYYVNKMTSLSNTKYIIANML